MLLTLIDTLAYVLSPPRDKPLCTARLWKSEMTWRERIRGMRDNILVNLLVNSVGRHSYLNDDKNTPSTSQLFIVNGDIP